MRRVQAQKDWMEELSWQREERGQGPGYRKKAWCVKGTGRRPVCQERMDEPNAKLRRVLRP